MNAGFITKRLLVHYISHAYKFANVYFFKNESDLLTFSRSGYTYDFEIKVSRSDFNADFKKPRHAIMKAAMKGKELAVVPTGNNQKWICTFRTTFLGETRDRRERPGYCGINIKNVKESIANRFFFVVPWDMVSIEEIPDYAGLIYVSEDGWVKKIKDAPLLHKLKHDHNKMFDVMYNKYISLLHYKFSCFRLSESHV